MKYIKIHSNPNQMKTTSEIKISYPKKELLDDETIVAFVKRIEHMEPRFTSLLMDIKFISIDLLYDKISAT